MPNPLLQMLNAKQNQNNYCPSIREIMTGNIKDIYQKMLTQNPQFRQFVMDNESKTVEDIAMEYDIDINLLKKFM